ncbi:hypothetical protein DM01DRAFT_1290183, partial [Hesseltinella vesiculosa]
MSTPHSHSLSFGSLNCRSLIKSHNSNAQSLFIRHLRSLSLSLLAVQESHAITLANQESLNMQFQCSSSIWTNHCGLICFDPNLTVTNHETPVNLDQRVISTTIQHSQNAFPPFNLLVIYAPAAHSARQRFFLHLADFIHPTTLSNQTRTLVMGDFNQTPKPDGADWHSTLHRFFDDALSSDPGLQGIPTFTHSGNGSRSVIDFIYCSPDISADICHPQVSHIPSDWTDHALLKCLWRVGSSRGPSPCWRAKPHLASIPEFVKHLYTNIDQFLAHQHCDTPTAVWEEIKCIAKATAQRFMRKRPSVLERQTRHLMSRRNRLLRLSQTSAVESCSALLEELAIVEHKLSLIQREQALRLELRAKSTW